VCLLKVSLMDENGVMVFEREIPESSEETDSVPSESSAD
jgi:hypothetical protein